MKILINNRNVPNFTNELMNNYMVPVLGGN